MKVWYYREKVWFGGADRERAAAWLAAVAGVGHEDAYSILWDDANG